MNNMSVPVLLDMDPGVDDALAILLAVASPELDIKALTVCGGNVALRQCAANTLKTLAVAGADSSIPVALGASRPLRRPPFRAAGIHGADGLGCAVGSYPSPSIVGLRQDAAHLIIEMALSHGDSRRSGADTPLTIIATGPLTNIAQAISLDPEAMRRVERIVWMGGSYASPGNITPVAEFNAFCDPDAAAEVLGFGVPMTLVGLDACCLCPLQRDEVESMSARQNRVAVQFAADISRMYMEFYKRQEGFHGCYLHDPLAVGLAIRPDLATVVEKHHVQVVVEPGPAWGMTVIDRRRRNPWLNDECCAAVAAVPAAAADTLQGFGVLSVPPHIEVVLAVNGSAFVDFFNERLLRL